MRLNRFLTPAAMVMLVAGCRSDSRPLATEPPAGTSGHAATDIGVDGGAESNTSTGRGTITVKLLMRSQAATTVPFMFDHRRFSLDNGGSTRASDAQTFTNLKAGSYSVQALAQPDGPFAAIRCTSTGTDNNTVDVVNGTVAIGLEAGETVECTYIGEWPTGSLVTYDQDAYGDATSAGGMLVASKFDALFGTGLEIGIDGTAGFSATLDMATAVFSFLPQVDAPGILTSDTLDPSDTHAGVFAGDLVALTMNVALSDAGVLGGTSSTRIGDLYICGSPLPVLNGQTVRQFLATANTLVGGGDGPFSVGVADSIALLINEAFIGGTPSSFAQVNLFSTPCP